QDRLDAGDETEDIDLVLPMDLLARSRLDRPERAIAGIIEPDVDSPEGLDRLIDGPLWAVRLLHVESEKLEARGFDEVLFDGGIAHRRGDVPALVEKEPRRRLADAAAGAGDDDGLRRVRHRASRGLLPAAAFPRASIAGATLTGALRRRQAH